MAYVELVSVSAGYGRTATILNGIDLAVDKGQILCLVGPNGAGKSTLLKTIAGLLPLISGSVYIDGKPVPESGRERAKLIASVFTTPPKTEYMSVYDVVAGGRYAHTGGFDILHDADRAVIEHALIMTDTDAIGDRDFGRLSDGQRQRVMLARALAMEPRLMILDEPVSHLDIYYKKQVFDILRRLRSENEISVIMSLHEPGDVMDIADKVAGLKNGGICFIGSPIDVMTDENIHRLFFAKSEI